MSIVPYLLIVIWIVVAEAHFNDQACARSNELTQLLCSGSQVAPNLVKSRPGKKGEKGGIGPQGVAGERGPPGIVDYETVGDIVDEKLIQYDQKFEKLNLKLEEVKTELATLKKREELCELKFENKCFWVDGQASRINFEKGKEVCLKHGAQLANVYSKAHFEIVMAYLRSRMAGRNEANVWLGMTFDVSARTISLLDGSPGPKMDDLKWYPGFPNNNAAWSVMGIVARYPLDSPSIGIHNFPSASTRLGSLCEL